MEEVLDTYAMPYNESLPVLCMDEQPVQLLNEVRKPIAATTTRPQRVDYEYERAGTACVFMFVEPLSGWRSVRVRQRRTKIDWAFEVEEVLRTQYKDAEKVILICDNLNVHTRGAFYEAFPVAQAREIIRRIEFRYTPKHGSWLNVAESELSALTRQCLKNRRIGDIDTLREEASEWAASTNTKQRGVDWHFTIEQARHKLKSIYPKIIE